MAIVASKPAPMATAGGCPARIIGAESVEPVEPSGSAEWRRMESTAVAVAPVRSPVVAGAGGPGGG